MVMEFMMKHFVYLLQVEVHVVVCRQTMRIGDEVTNVTRAAPSRLI